MNKVLSEKIEAERKLKKKEEDANKLESKLQATQKEKTMLETKVASAEKHLAQFTKSNEILKNKVNFHLHIYFFIVLKNIEFKCWYCWIKELFNSHW